jgi:hypothetical protein
MGNKLNDKGPIHPCRFCTVMFPANLTCISGPASHLDAEKLGFLPRIITDVSAFDFMHAILAFYSGDLCTVTFENFSPSSLATRLPDSNVARLRCIFFHRNE